MLAFWVPLGLSKGTTITDFSPCRARYLVETKSVPREVSRRDPIRPHEGSPLKVSLSPETKKADSVARAGSILFIILEGYEVFIIPRLAEKADRDS